MNKNTRLSASHLLLSILAVLLWGAPSQASSYLSSLEITDKNTDHLKNLADFTEVQTMSVECLSSVRAIPESLGKMPKLRDLQIDLGEKCGNPLKLPESLGMLQNLRRLTLSGFGSAFRAPKNLDLLKSLEFLDLSRDGLTEVPAFVGELSTLQELRLTWNPALKKLPQFLSKLKDLRILRLDGDDLADLPQALEKLPQLTTLTVVHNCRMTQDKSKLETLKRRFPRVFFSFFDEHVCK